MKASILALCLALRLGSPGAHALGWQPTPGHSQMPIWPGKVPGARLVSGQETTKDDTVTNVSQPTMTLYSPKGKNTGVAVVVFPGGGYRMLAMGLEGTEVCDWLTSKGITAVLLKYRVPGNWGRFRTSPMALQDAQRTMGLVRQHAAQWHLDPHKIGVLGFSAGGHLVAAMSTQFEKRTYPSVDAADQESCRPDFAVALYPGHLAVDADEFKPAGGNWLNGFSFNPDVRVPRTTSPTFLLQAQNDPIDPVENSLLYFAALRKAHVPVELHIYARGGHAFGLRRTPNPITAWPQLVETWLGTIGILAP